MVGPMCYVQNISGSMPYTSIDGISAGSTAGKEGLPETSRAAACLRTQYWIRCTKDEFLVNIGF